MRKLSLTVAVLVAAVVSFALSNLKAEVRRSADQYAAELSERSGARLAVGELGFDLFPFPAVELRRLELGVSAEGASGLRVRALRVYPRLLPLLAGRAVVSRLRASGVELVVRRNEAGKMEIPPLAAARLAAGRGGRITIDRSRLLIEDMSGRVPARLEVVGFKLELTAEETATVFTLEGAPLGTGSRLRASGRVSGQAGEIDAKFSIRRGRVDTLVAAFPSLGGLTLDGPVSLSGTVRGPLATFRAPTDDLAEGAPPEPVDVELEAASGLRLYGVGGDAGLEARLALDGRRLVMREGRLVWGGLEAGLSGWTETRTGGRMSLRLSFEGVDLPGQLDDLGLPLPWPAEAVFDGLLRIDGTREKPRMSYRAVADGVLLAKDTAWAAEAGRVEVNGNIKAINADFSASFGIDGLQVGSTYLDKARVGTLYWRDKVTITALESPVFGGKTSLSAVIYPDEDWRVEGGVVLSDVDAARVATVLGLAAGRLPRGRLDALGHYGRDQGRAWGQARVAFHLGAIPGPSPVDAVAEQLLSAPAGFQPAPWSFERLAFDAEREVEGWRVAAFAAESTDGRFDGAGRVGDDGQALLTGQVSFDAATAARMVVEGPELAGLLGEDGTLVVGVGVSGTLGQMEVRPDQEFGAELARLRAGLPVVWPRPPRQQPRGGIEVDLPGLVEHFGR